MQKSQQFLSMSDNPVYLTKNPQHCLVNFLQPYLSKQEISTAFHWFLKLQLMEPGDFNSFYQILTTLLVGPQNLNILLWNAYAPTYKIKKLTIIFYQCLTILNIWSKYFNSFYQFLTTLLIGTKNIKIFSSVFQIPTYGTRKSQQFLSMSYNPTYMTKKF